MGIVRQLTQAHAPHQNGIAERKNRSLLEKARCMAFASNTPSYLWPKAVATANYVINRTATRANHGTTPYEKFTGHTPSISHLRTFGCRSCVLNTSPSRKKWAPRSYECVFLGYDETSRGFKSYNRSTQKILVSKDVQFDENHFPFSSLVSKANNLTVSPAGDEWPVTKHVVFPEEEHTPIATNVPVSPSGSVPFVFKHDLKTIVTTVYSIMSNKFSMYLTLITIIIFKNFLIDFNQDTSKYVQSS